MRRRLSPLLLLATLLLAAGARADTIILTNGEKLDGKIVKETDIDYTIDYKISAGITDTRTVLKVEVSKVIKETPDDLAFQTLKNYKPGPNSLPLTSYDGTVHALDAFLSQFPQSPHAAEITAANKAFKEEKTRVEGGEIKLDGKWISKEQVAKEGYQIKGHTVYAYMQDQARRGDLVGALNAFDQLERSFPGSSVYPDAIGLAHQLLEQLKARADQMLQTWLYQKKERDTSTQLMAEPQRTQTIAAQKREAQQLDATLAAAAKNGLKWPALQPHHDPTLIAISTKALSELHRVDLIPIAKLRESLQWSEQGRAAYAKGDLSAADEAFKEATKRWSTNELAVRLAKEVSAQKLALSRATPVPVVAVATPAPATPRPAAERATPIGTVVTQPEEAKGFFSTLPGLALIVIVLGGLGGGYVAYKKKKQAAEQNVG